jgi:hypothetical protein
MVFRRATLVAFATTALILAGASGAARASGAQVIQDRFHGPFAEAAWESSTPSSITDVGLLTSREQNGTTHLSVGLQTTYLDANGNVTGSLALSGELTGPSFSFDTLRLSNASASGIVPVTRCTFDAAGNTTGCTDGILDVSATWAGQGPMSRGNEYVDWFVQPGDFTYVDRGSGTFRSASATATIGGQTFDASDLQFADLGVSNDLTLTICPHGC